MIPTYKENDYIPSEALVYRVTYSDGATYEYGPGHSRLVENIPANVREAQHNASCTTPAKLTEGIEWFEGAGVFMFFVLFILPLLLCVIVYGIYPVLLISGIVK